MFAPAEPFEPRRSQRTFRLVAESDLVATVAERVASAMARKLGLLIRPCPVATRCYSLTLVWPARLEQDEGHRWLRQRLEHAGAQ